MEGGSGHTFLTQVVGVGAELRLGVGAILCRRGSLWSVGRGTLFELKSWVWVLDCEWLWVRSCDDEAARCGAWVGAHSF